MTFNWIVVKTKSQNENKAFKNLKKQGYDVFYPKVLKNIIFFNKLKKATKPFFPGYIFVNLRKNDNWYKINNTIGVSRIIQFGSKIPFLPAYFIEKIKDKCDDNGIYDQEEPINRGDNIKIKKDYLYQIDGIFDEYIGTNRAIILLDILGSKVKTVIDRDNIEAVN